MINPKVAAMDAHRLAADFAVQRDPYHALRAVRLFEPYDPYWIEEPLAGDDLDALAEFRANTGRRITTGERQSGIHHYRNILDRRKAMVVLFQE